MKIDDVIEGKRLFDKLTNLSTALSKIEVLKGCNGALEVSICAHSFQIAKRLCINLVRAEIRTVQDQLAQLGVSGVGGNE